MLVEQDPLKEEGVGLREVSSDEILELQRAETVRMLEREERRQQILRDRGFQPEGAFEDAY